MASYCMFTILIPHIEGLNSGESSEGFQTPRVGLLITTQCILGIRNRLVHFVFRAVHIVTKQNYFS